MVAIPTSQFWGTETELLCGPALNQAMQPGLELGQLVVLTTPPRKLSAASPDGICANRKVVLFSCYEDERTELVGLPQPGRGPRPRGLGFAPLRPRRPRGWSSRWHGAPSLIHPARKYPRPSVPSRARGSVNWHRGL